VKPPHVANDNLIDRTREVWEPRQIAEDVTGFFAILAEWSRAQLPIPVNDDSKSSNSDGGEMRHES